MGADSAVVDELHASFAIRNLRIRNLQPPLPAANKQLRKYFKHQPPRERATGSREAEAAPRDLDFDGWETVSRVCFHLRAHPLNALTTEQRISRLPLRECPGLVCHLSLVPRSAFQNATTRCKGEQTVKVSPLRVLTWIVPAAPPPLSRKEPEGLPFPKQRRTAAPECTPGSRDESASAAWITSITRNTGSRGRGEERAMTPSAPLVKRRTHLKNPQNLLRTTGFESQFFLEVDSDRGYFLAVLGSLRFENGGRWQQMAQAKYSICFKGPFLLPIFGCCSWIPHDLPLHDLPSFVSRWLPCCSSTTSPPTRSTSLLPRATTPSAASLSEQCGEARQDPRSTGDTYL